MGPGKVSLDIFVAVRQLFITSLQNLNESFSSTMTDGFTITISKAYLVAASQSSFAENQATLGDTIAFSRTLLDMQRLDVPSCVAYFDVKLEAADFVNGKYILLLSTSSVLVQY